MGVFANLVALWSHGAEKSVSNDNQVDDRGGRGKVGLC